MKWICFGKEKTVPMPIYEYICKTCNRPYEFLIRHKDEASPKCPHCGSNDARKVISTASVIRSRTQRDTDRMTALSKVNPKSPQEVARHLKQHGSRFGDADFRGKKAWKDAVDRVAEGGPTLADKD